MAKKKLKLLKIDNKSINFIASGVYVYTLSEDEALDDCAQDGAFLTREARNFGIRAGDLVICKTSTEATNVVVK